MGLGLINYCHIYLDNYISFVAQVLYLLQELSGRIIRVELAKSFKKPFSITPTKEIRSWIYVSNLAWKVRSGDLRVFFADKFKPVSARVVFTGPLGTSAGYGFVSFVTNEEAEAAISELDGKVTS